MENYLKIFGIKALQIITLEGSYFYVGIAILKPSLDNYERNDIFFIQIGRAVLEFIRVSLAKTARLGSTDLIFI